MTNIEKTCDECKYFKERKNTTMGSCKILNKILRKKSKVCESFTSIEKEVLSITIKNGKKIYIYKD